MKKRIFTFLFIAFLMLIITTGCKKDPVVGLQGIQGETGPQGNPGENGVGIETTYYENGFLVIKYTDGTTEKISIKDILTEEELNFSTIIELNEDTSINIIKLRKNHLLLDELVKNIELNEYTKELINEVYYNGVLADKDTVITEDGELYITLMEYDDIDLYGDKSDEYSSMLNQITNSTLTGFIYQFSIKMDEYDKAKSEVVFVDELLEYTEKHFNDLKAIVDNYKEALKIEVSLLIEKNGNNYAPSQNAIIKQNIENLYAEIDACTSYEEAIELIPNFKNKIFANTENIPSDDMNLVNYKRRYIRQINTILSSYTMNYNLENTLSYEGYKNFVYLCKDISLADSINEIDELVDEFFTLDIVETRHNFEKMYYDYYFGNDIMKDFYSNYLSVDYANLLANADGEEYINIFIDYLVNESLVDKIYYELYLKVIDVKDFFMLKSSNENFEKIFEIVDKFRVEKIKTIEIKNYGNELLNFETLIDELYVELSNSIDNGELILQLYKEFSDLQNAKLFAEDIEEFKFRIASIQSTEELEMYHLDLSVAIEVRKNSQYNSLDINTAVRTYFEDIIHAEVKEFAKNYEDLKFLNYVIEENNFVFRYFDKIGHRLGYMDYYNYTQNKDEFAFGVIKEYIYYNINNWSYYDVEQAALLSKVENAETKEALDEILITDEYKLYSGEYLKYFSNLYAQLNDMCVALNDLYINGNLLDEDIEIYNTIVQLNSEGYNWAINFEKFTINFENEDYLIFDKTAYDYYVKRTEEILLTGKEVLNKYNS